MCMPGAPEHVLKGRAQRQRMMWHVACMVGVTGLVPGAVVGATAACGRLLPTQQGCSGSAGAPTCLGVAEHSTVLQHPRPPPRSALCPVQPLYFNRGGGGSCSKGRGGMVLCSSAGVAMNDALQMAGAGPARGQGRAGQGGAGWGWTLCQRRLGWRRAAGTGAGASSIPLAATAVARCSTSSWVRGAD